MSVSLSVCVSAFVVRLNVKLNIVINPPPPPPPPRPKEKRGVRGGERKLYLDRGEAEGKMGSTKDASIFLFPCDVSARIFKIGWGGGEWDADWEYVSCYSNASTVVELSDLTEVASTSRYSVRFD